MGSFWIFLSKVYLHFCHVLSQLMPSKGIWEHFNTKTISEQRAAAEAVPTLLLESLQGHFHGVVEDGFLMEGGSIYTLDEVAEAASEGLIEGYVVCYGRGWESLFPGLREIAEGTGKRARALAAIRHGAAWAHVHIARSRHIADGGTPDWE